MSNIYNKTTKLHIVDGTGTIMESNTSANIVQVVYMANTASHDLVIHDAKGNTATVLKASPSDASPVRLPMEEGGRKFDGLKIQVIDSGKAYIYLCKS